MSSRRLSTSLGLRVSTDGPLPSPGFLSAEANKAATVKRAASNAYLKEEVMQAMTDEANRKRDEEELKGREEQKRIDQERAALQRADDERRRKKEEDDTAELNNISSVEPTSTYSYLSSRTYESFNKITKMTRELHTERLWAVPEIIFIGHQGSGKSTAIELFLGHPLAGGFETKRPIQIHFVSNQAYDKPQITVRRDPLDPYSTEKVVEPKDLHSVLEKSNTLTESPITIRYEWKNTFTFSLIDLPGLFLEKPHNVNTMSAEEVSFREQLVSSTVKGSPDSTLVFVSEALPWDNSPSTLLTSQYDPRMNRSLVVHTHFHILLSSFQSTRDVQSYFNAKPAGTNNKSFFVSMFASKTRSNLTDDESFQQMIERSQQRDANTLKRLKVEPRNEAGFGTQSFRRHLIEVIGKKYQDYLPELSKIIRTNRTQNIDQLDYVRNMVRTLDHSKLRMQATNYVSDFCRYQIAMLLGSEESMEGQLTSSGQTLEEEKLETSDWEDADGKNLYATLGISQQDVPNYNVRLYGGNQLERLLSEYKIVMDRIIMENTSEDDIVNACGASGLHMSNNRIWAASDIAQQKCVSLIRPLMYQLLARAVYIIKRQTTAVKHIMDSRKHKSLHTRGNMYSSDQGAYDAYVRDCRKFLWFVQDSFEQVVDDAAELVLTKCVDELRCIQMVCWAPGSIRDSQSEKNRKSISPAMKKNITFDSVERLASDAFQIQQQRISRNICLKIYDGFLSRMQISLSAALQGRIALLPESSMAELFDLDMARDVLRKEEQRLQTLIDGDQESAFKETTIGFKPWF